MEGTRDQPQGGGPAVGVPGAGWLRGRRQSTYLGVRGIRRERSVLNRNGVYLRPAWYFRRVPPFVVLYIRDIGQLNLLTGAEVGVLFIFKVALVLSNCLIGDWFDFCLFERRGEFGTMTPFTVRTRGGSSELKNWQFAPMTPLQAACCTVPQR